MSADLSGQHVVITGGSSGIGKALAQLYGCKGASVTLIARDSHKLVRAVTELNTLGILAVNADVTSREEMDAALGTAIEMFGPPDIVICCAGVARAARIDDLSVSDFADVMNTNYLGTVITVLSVHDTMKSAGKGHIVLVASGAAPIGLPGYAAYGPSKAAVVSFGQTLRAELAHTPVKVSIVYPPDVDTPQLAAENETKPEELRTISGSASIWSAEDAALVIARGIRKGSFNITIGTEMRLLVHGTSLLSPLLQARFGRISARTRKDAATI